MYLFEGIGKLLKEPEMEEPRSQRERNSLRRALNLHAVFPLGAFTELQWHKTKKTGRKKNRILNILQDWEGKKWNLGFSG